MQIQGSTTSRVHVAASASRRATAPKPEPNAESPATVVRLSPQAEAQLKADAELEAATRSPEDGETKAPEDAEDTDEISPEQREYITQLQSRDSEVRAHEAAHQGAGGGLAGAASFSYQAGPDGRQYAIGGEVPIDMSGGSTPAETIARAKQIRAAAMAPADPSGQDRSVAAAASQMEAAAQMAQADAVFEEREQVAEDQKASTEERQAATEMPTTPDDSKAEVAETQVDAGPSRQQVAQQRAARAFSRIAALA